MQKKKARGINKIEVIYKGDILKEEKANSLEYEASKTGWYIVCAVSNKGKLRYAWVRVSSTMVAPKIEIISPTPKPTSGWYKEKVIVRITAGSETTSKIYYTTNHWKEDPILEITSENKIDGTNLIGKDIEITAQGVTNIYAYATNGDNGESEAVRQDVLIDSIAPVIKDIVITGIKGENGWYRGNVGISLINAKDNSSGVKGYYYYIPTEEEIKNNFIPEITQMTGDKNGNALNINDTTLSISNDGIKTTIIRLEDKAGNISAPITVTVKVDNTPPKTPVLNFSEVRQTSFVLSSLTTDNLSKVTYDFYLIESSGENKLIESTKVRRDYSNKTRTKHKVYCICRSKR